MSISSLESESRPDARSRTQGSLFQRLAEARWGSVQKHIAFQSLQYSPSSSRSETGIAAVETWPMSWLDRDVITLFLIISVVIASLWFGQKTREISFGGCTTSPPSMEFVPELDVAMTVKSGAACAIWARAMTPFIDALDIETPPYMAH